MINKTDVIKEVENQPSRKQLIADMYEQEEEQEEEQEFTQQNGAIEMKPGKPST